MRTTLEQHHAHDRFMALALVEATAALERGDIPVGAVIVHDGEVVSTGRNAVESTRDDLAHAEHCAIARVPQFLWTHRRRCTLYTTLEPCALCAGAAIYSSIDRIVWGAFDPLCATTAMVQAIPYYAKKPLVLVGGVLEGDCQALLNEYTRRSPQRPYLYKSVDARAAPA